MTPDQLKFDAAAIYGREWQAPLAADLLSFSPSGRVSRSLVRLYATGARRIPEWVDGALIEIARRELPDLQKRARWVEVIAARTSDLDEKRRREALMGYLARGPVQT